MSTEIQPYPSTRSEEIGDYRPLSAAAVTSVLLGLLGSVAFLSLGLLLVPILGLLSGLYALWQISRRADELAGRGLAWIGVGLSGFSLVLAPPTLVIVAWNRVPPGCLEIGYEQLQPEEGTGQLIPPFARQLEGKKIYIEGFVFPGSSVTRGIKQFLLVRDRGTCCFGGNPKITDRIEVTLDDPLRLTFNTRINRVAGVFHVEVASAQEARGAVYYHLQAFHLQ